MNCAYEKVTLWLEELSSVSNSQHSLTEDGYAKMVSDDDIDVTISAIKGHKHLSIYIELVRVPITDSLELFKKCLGLNLDQGATAGGSICFDEIQHSLVLVWSGLVEKMSFEEFYETIQVLMATSSSLTESLLKNINESAPSITDISLMPIDTTQIFKA